MPPEIKVLKEKSSLDFMTSVASSLVNVKVSLTDIEFKLNYWES